MKAETRVLFLQAREYPRLPGNHQEPGSPLARNRFPLTTLRRKQPSWYLDLELPVSRTVRQWISTHFVDLGYSSPGKLMQGRQTIQTSVNIQDVRQGNMLWRKTKHFEGVGKPWGRWEWWLFYSWWSEKASLMEGCWSMDLQEEREWAMWVFTRGIVK